MSGGNGKEREKEDGTEQQKTTKVEPKVEQAKVCRGYRVLCLSGRKKAGDILKPADLPNGRKQFDNMLKDGVIK